jgi:hypothetical protein
MGWQRDNRRDLFSIEEGSCRCLVWQSGSMTWTATVAMEGYAYIHDSFRTLEDAQAWCLKQLAQRRRGLFDRAYASCSTA